MSDSDLNHYRDLCRERKTHSWIWSGGALAFIVCAFEAYSSGPSAGWPWLVGALASLFVFLWGLVEYVHYDLLVSFHLLPHEIRISDTSDEGGFDD